MLPSPIPSEGAVLFHTCFREGFKQRPLLRRLSECVGRPNGNALVEDAPAFRSRDDPRDVLDERTGKKRDQTTRRSPASKRSARPRQTSVAGEEFSQWGCRLFCESVGVDVCAGTASEARDANKEKVPLESSSAAGRPRWPCTDLPGRPLGH